VTVIDRLSLLHGVLPWAVPALAAAGLGVAAVRRGRRWWTVTLPSLAIMSAALITVAQWCLRHSGTVRDHYPPTFLLWVGAVPLAALVAAAGWRSARWWRRTVAMITVPLTCASALVLINAHYGYWPTAGDLLGRPLPHQISREALDGLLHDTPASPASTPSPAAEAADGPGISVAGGLGPAVAAPDTLPGSIAPTLSHGRAGRTELAAPARTPGVHGVLVALDIPPGTSEFSSRRGTLYLPPAFFGPSPPPLPVVVLLGGTPGGPDAWPRSGALQTVDAYAGRHHGVAPILAFVDQNGSFLADTECVDGPAGAAETFLAIDVPHFLSGFLHVPLDPERWAIGGFSEGGTCAFELGVRHPDVYRTFVDIAGDWAPNLGSAGTTLARHYGGDEQAMAAHDPTRLLKADGLGGLGGWFVVGASDSSHVGVARRLASASRAAGITTTTEILPGDHTWRFVVSAFRLVFPSIASGLPGMAPPAPSGRA
jgi:S-formylglutathione hydrolase FrmB